MKNESIGAEMIDIMQSIQERYVPCHVSNTENEQTKKKTVVQKIFFGGDNLTEERGRNLQGAMSEADSEFDRLDGLITKNEDWHAIRYIYHILFEIFYDPNSSKDIASMEYNMNLVRNSNARGNVLDKFNACKDYVNFETDALITTLAMTYFGIDDIDSPSENVIPPMILCASNERKQEWFIGHVKKLVQDFIIGKNMEHVADIQQSVTTADQERQTMSFACRFPGCTKQYRNKKVRASHEVKIHSFEVQENKEDKTCGEMEQDDVLNYAGSRLNLGLLIRNAEDAVKEGDGKRIIRCWRFFLLYFKAYKHHKYAYAAFLLLARVEAISPPAEAEQLVWDRTVNRKGGKGRNISCDLRLEQLNCLTKELLHNLGVNLNEKNAKRESHALDFLQKMLESTDKDLTTTMPSGHHKVKSKKNDFDHLVKNLLSKKVFKLTPGREHEHFNKFERNLLSPLAVSSLINWLKDQKKKLVKTYSK
eukprot:gene8580-9497_t